MILQLTEEQLNQIVEQKVKEAIHQLTKPVTEERLYTLREVQEKLGITAVGLYKMRLDGRIKAIGEGRLTRIPESALIKYLNRKKIA